MRLASLQPYTTPGGESRHAVRWREDGKQRWRSFRYRKSAIAFKRDKEAELELGPLYQAEPEKLAAFLEGWLERHALKVRPSTLKRRREALKALDLPDEYLTRLSVAAVDDAATSLAKRAPRQAQIALAAFKIALRDAEGRGQRFDPNLLKIRPPRYEERQARFLTWPEVEKLASFLPEQVKRLVLVASLTGLRQGELFALAESDLSLPAARLRVRRSKTKAGERSVELPPLAVELLREQLLARPHTEALVFPAPKGGAWGKSNFMHRVFRPATRSAGLEGVTFHALRHTAVSLMAAAGWRPEHIATQVGHSDGGALILRRYRHLFSGEMEAQVAKLEEFIRPPRQSEERAG